MKRTLIMVTVLLTTLSFGSMKVNAQEVSDHTDCSCHCSAQQWQVSERNENNISKEDLAAPRKHFYEKEKKCSIPVFMNWEGTWIDQFGDVMTNSQAWDYLKRYPDYCAAIININLDLTDLDTDTRNHSLEELNRYTVSINEVKGNYSFIENKINHFRGNGIYALMGMCPSETKTVEAYCEQTGCVVKRIPICQKDGNWIDQFGKTMEQSRAEVVFEKYPAYQEVLIKVDECAQQAEIDNNGLIADLQETYNLCFLRHRYVKRHYYKHTKPYERKEVCTTHVFITSRDKALSMKCLIDDYNDLAQKYASSYESEGKSSINSSISSAHDPNPLRVHKRKTDEPTPPVHHDDPEKPENGDSKRNSTNRKQLDEFPAE